MQPWQPLLHFGSSSTHFIAAVLYCDMSCDLAILCSVLWNQQLLWEVCVSSCVPQLRSRTLFLSADMMISSSAISLVASFLKPSPLVSDRYRHVPMPYENKQSRDIHVWLMEHHQSKLVSESLFWIRMIVHVTASFWLTSWDAIPEKGESSQWPDWWLKWQKWSVTQ